MRYENFDLWIDAGIEGRYPVRAASPLGEVRESLSLDPGWREIRPFQDRLAERKIDQAGLTDLGSRLYRWLFAGDIELLFERSAGRFLGEAERGLRVRLRIEAPELIALPWEFLYWPNRDRFLGTSVQCPLVRYLEIFAPISNLEVSLPLGMLVVIPDSTDLDVAEEKASLLQTLAGLEDRVELSFLEGTVTATKISDALLEGRFHLFHFIGHGEFDGDRAFLRLNAEDGASEYVDGARFASLFANHPTLKLVFLNACKGAETSPTAPLAGMAYQLVQQGVPAVVAMQYAIYDEAAILFSREFYRSLFKSRARGRVEFAVSHARNRLLGEFAGERDIGAPVLFMRASEGLLFNIVTGNLAKDLPIANGDYRRCQVAERTYRQNIETLERQYRETSDPLIKDSLDQNSKELSRLKQVLGLRRVGFSVAIGASLFVFCLSWLRLFDFLPPAVRLESYAVGLAGLFFSERRTDERVAVVVIDEQTERELGKPFGKDWRREHAILIDKLSRARAKVIAFDLFFEDPTPFDTEFAGAIKQASERGTTVVVGYRDLLGDQPKIVQPLRDAGAKPGLLCIGKKSSSAQLAPLVVRKEDQRFILHSLALESGAAFLGRELAIDQKVRNIDFLDQITRQSVTKVAVSETDEVKWEQPGCPAIDKRDIAASIIIDPSRLPAPDATQSKAPYQSIVKDRHDDDFSYFRDKIVLVGIERKDDLFPVRHGITREERYGVELHSAIIRSLLDGRTIRTLDYWPELMLMVGLGLLGGFIRIETFYWQALFRAGLLWTTFLLYFVIVSYVFHAYLVIVNTIYHLLVFSLSYWTVATVKRRWFA